MRKRPLFIFLISLVLCVGVQKAYCDEPNPFQRALSALSNSKAGQQICFAKRIDDVLRPASYLKFGSVGVENAGLIKYFSRLVQKPCFGELAKQFWDKVNADTVNNIQPGPPDINEVAGTGPYKAYPPGWLWKRALADSKNDANVAMDLLGLCLHDDLLQDPLKRLNPSASAIELRKEISLNEKALEKIKEQARNLSANPNAKAELEANETQQLLLVNMIKLSKEDITKHKSISVSAVNCPPWGSPAYAPQSLGSEIDIPEKLKRAVVAAERPGQKDPHLPAKAYHFIGGAIIGCEAAKCGVPKSEAANISAFLARAYRVARLEQEIRRLFRERDRVSRAVGSSIGESDFPEKAAKFLTQEDSGNEHRRSAALIDQMTHEYDAATLYSKWYLGGSVGLYSDIRVAGPPELTAESPNCEMPAWSKSRCQAALLTLDTWDLDEKWTMAQHKVGAEFGAAHCYPVRMQDETHCPKSSSADPKGNSKAVR